MPLYRAYGLDEKGHGPPLIIVASNDTDALRTRSGWSMATILRFGMRRGAWASLSAASAIRNACSRASPESLERSKESRHLRRRGHAIRHLIAFCRGKA